MAGASGDQTAREKLEEVEADLKETQADVDAAQAALGSTPPAGETPETPPTDGGPVVMPPIAEPPVGETGGGETGGGLTPGDGGIAEGPADGAPTGEAPAETPPVETPKEPPTDEAPVGPIEPPTSQPGEQIPPAPVEPAASTGAYAEEVAQAKAALEASEGGVVTMAFGDGSKHEEIAKALRDEGIPAITVENEATGGTNVVLAGTGEGLVDSLPEERRADFKETLAAVSAPLEK